VLAPALACEFLHPGANSREIVGSTHHFLPGFDGERRLTGLVLYSARRVYGEARPKTGRDDQDLFFALRCNSLTMRPAKRGSLAGRIDTRVGAPGPSMRSKPVGWIAR
jgi:hypothetical protein